MPVEQRDIVVSAQASGAIQPDTTVEVKSKASGEILQLSAETGQVVKRGRPAGAHRSAQRRGTPWPRLRPISTSPRPSSPTPTSQKQRADELFKSQSITEQEHEQALLDYADAKAEVVRSQVAVDNAQDPAGRHRRPRADHRNHHREGRRAGHGDCLGHVERERRHHAAQDGRTSTWFRCGLWWMKPTSGRSRRASLPP